MSYIQLVVHDIHVRVHSYMLVIHDIHIHVYIIYIYIYMCNFQRCGGMLSVLLITVDR